MQWHRVGGAPLQEAAVKAERVTSDLWLFRQSSWLAAWRESEGAPLWQEKLSEDSLIYNELVVRDTLMFTLVHCGKDNAIQIAAHEIRNGKKRWVKEWPIRPAPDGGLVSVAGALFLFGMDAKNRKTLIEINPDTGATVVMHRLPGALMSIRAGDGRLLIVNEGGVSEWRDNEARQILKQDQIRDSSLCGSECALRVGDHVNPPWRVMMLDVSTGRLIAEHDLGETILQPVPKTIGGGRVLLMPRIEQTGLHLWDARKNRIVWTRQTTGLVIQNVVVGNVVVSAVADNLYNLTVIATDADSGAEVAAPEATPATRNIFAAGETLVLADSEGVTAWRLEAPKGLRETTKSPKKARAKAASGDSPVGAEWSMLFNALKVASYRAALPEGQIEWLNGDGAAVASASCRVIASYAADHSFQWGWANKDLVAAGVPVIEKGDGEPKLDDVEAEEAQELAVNASLFIGCAFVYIAKAGATNIFLGISDFKLGKGAPEVAKESVTKALTGYARLASERAVTLLRAGGERATVTAALKNAADTLEGTSSAWQVDTAAEAESLRTLAARVEAGDAV